MRRVKEILISLYPVGGVTAMIILGLYMGGPPTLPCLSIYKYVKFSGRYFSILLYTSKRELTYTDVRTRLVWIY